ncbi:hypothetical protein F441_18926, partial [Phytophthora nicotianae CJ01A1]
MIARTALKRSLGVFSRPAANVAAPAFGQSRMYHEN